MCDENPIKNLLTPDYKVTEIKLLRKDSNFKTTALLILEGTDDGKFFKKIANTEKCHFIIAYGKENLLKIIEILKKEKLFDNNGILAVIDKDYDEILGKLNTDKNIFYTDFHDVECFLLYSPALDELLSVKAVGEKVKSFKKQHNVSDIRKLLFEKALVVGCLRLLSNENQLYLDFDSLELQKYIDKDTLELDLTVYVNELKINSINKTNSSPKIGILEKQNIIEKVRNLNFADEIENTKVFATFNSQKIKYFNIFEDLLLAYRLDYFANTTLFASITEWESQNIPYVVLKTH